MTSPGDDERRVEYEAVVGPILWRALSEHMSNMEVMSLTVQVADRLVADRVRGARTMTDLDPAGIKAARNAYYDIPLDAEVPAYASLEAFERAVAAYLSRVSPSRDGSVAVEDVARLVEALRPFVDAYDAVDRTFCPEFNGPEALAHFDRAAEVLAEFSPASTGDEEENDERRP